MAKSESKSSTRVVSSTFTFSSYLEQTRDLFTSIILVLPLFILYQIGILMTGGVRNGVDFVTDVLWLLADGQLLYYLGINLGILVVFGIALFFLRKRGTFRPKIWPGVVLESTVYALLLGSTVIYLMSGLGMGALLNTGATADFGVLTAFVMSLGAGLYEETVFRLIGMGGLFLVGTRVLKLPVWLSAVAAVLLSSLVFSAIHYVGPMGDAFQLGSFVFRFIAGAILAVIFYLRGFAIAVYTHAIYDVIVMVFN